MSARVRVLLVNMKHPLFKTVPLPKSVYDLADPRYKRASCIGNPLFGTTTLHCLAIFQQLGEEKATSCSKKCSRTGFICSVRRGCAGAGREGGTSHSA